MRVVSGVGKRENGPVFQGDDLTKEIRRPKVKSFDGQFYDMRMH